MIRKHRQFGFREFGFRQAGFNLLDLLIGVAISLFGLLAVAVVFRDFGQQRTTQVNASESQTNGTMALYLIERDLGQAGYGMMGLQNCSYINYYNNGDAIPAHFNDPFLPGVATALTTLPVRIIDGGVGVSDSMIVQFGNPNAGTNGSLINNIVTYPSDYPISSAVGFAVGDKAVANINNICTMIEVTTNPISPSGTPVAVLSINHETSSPFNVNASPGGAGWNSVTAADLAATTKPFLYNLGGFVSRRYSVAPSSGTFALMLDEFPYTSPATPLVDEIVFMKAQYGIAGAVITPCPTASSKVVTAWVTGATAINNTTACHVIAVRVGVVARSPLLEKNGIDAPTTLTVLPAPPTGAGAAVTYTIPNLDANGKAHYRYRAYTTIIPLKNVIWSQ